MSSILFHVEHLERIRLFTSDLGVGVDRTQLELLDVYADWLAGEAAAAGGIGPNEEGSLLDRHILDAMTFLAPLDRSPDTLLDVGSGAGLPGIPLAIVLPGSSVTLVDRSGRRCDLLKRAVRVLGLENVEVLHADVTRLEHTPEVVVSRASLPPSDLLPHLRRLSDFAIVAGSTQSAPEVDGYERLKIESRYLDSPRWLLIMRKS